MISLRVGQFLYPYALIFGICWKLVSLFSTPFIVDKTKHYLNIKEEWDNLGNVRYEQQYESFGNSIGMVSYIGKWEPDPEGFYKREIKKYTIGKIDEELIKKIIEENDTLSLEDVFGEPLPTVVEIKNNISLEELNQEASLQATIYSEDENDFIMINESIEDNVCDTILFFLGILVVGVFFAIARDSVTGFRIEDCIREINSKYDIKEHLEDLKKQLEIKKDNYNFLTR